mgnify:CR=1 FL=1
MWDWFGGSWWSLLLLGGIAWLIFTLLGQGTAQ